MKGKVYKKHFPNMAPKKILISLLLQVKYFFQLVLVSPTVDQYELLRQQLLERLEHGNGEIIYDIGLGEGGFNMTYL